MEIRKATFKEVQQIRKHALIVLKESTMDHVHPTAEKARYMTPSLDGSSSYLVAVEDGELLGWIGVGTTFDFYTDKMVGIMTELYVYPRARRKGIAEQLCRQALVNFQREGYENVQLNVFSGNPAKALYDQLGFQDVATLMEKKL